MPWLFLCSQVYIIIITCLQWSSHVLCVWKYCLHHVCIMKAQTHTRDLWQPIGGYCFNNLLYNINICGALLCVDIYVSANTNINVHVYEYVFRGMNTWVQLLESTIFRALENSFCNNNMKFFCERPHK